MPAGSSYNKERCGVRRDYKRITINLITVFAVCALAGVIAGNILNSKRQSSIAASDNITVTDNYQVSTVDKSSADQILTRTSTVTVKDSMAAHGYILTARIAQSTISGATVTIGSDSSESCPIASPCTLPSDNSFRDIISSTESAAIDGGHTTEWEVKIVVPRGNYVLDIEYDERVSPVITAVSPSTNTTGGDIYISGINFVDIAGDDNLGLAGGGGIAIIGTSANNGVTVNGKPCLSYRILSPTEALCTLPELADSATYNVQMNSTTLGASNANRTVAYDNATKGYMQDFGKVTGTGNNIAGDYANCADMPMGLAIQLQDARNSARYRVKKMPDQKCWMVDNLAYAGGGTDTYGDIQTLTFANATASSGWNATTGIQGRYVTTNNFTGANKNDRNGNNIQNTSGSLDPTSADSIKCAGSATGNAPMSSICLSYLYNTCSTLGLASTTTPSCSGALNTGTGSGYASTGIIGRVGGYGGESKSAANQEGINSSSAGTICPAGWRVPVGQVGPSITATSNIRNEFNILNESMAMLTLFTNTTSTAINTGTGYYQNWQPNGSFLSVASGIFNGSAGYSLSSQSVSAGYRSSSLRSDVGTIPLIAYPGSVNPAAGTSNSMKRYGFAVRCVL